jgi:hypothetical protein
MKLADQVACCRTPFVIRRFATGDVVRLNNAAECAAEVAGAPIRFVLSDDLTRLCTALAYSKGARTLACADLLRVPAESVWIEWCSEPWERELERYGFQRSKEPSGRGDRRGVLLRASRDGRRGLLRTFWSGDAPGDVLAGSVEAYFDLDTPEGEDPEPPPGESPALSEAQRKAVWRHALGTVVIDVPLILGFLLLLGTRSGLPQRPQSFERLNRSRLKAGKPALLEHIDVCAPILPGHARWDTGEMAGVRKSPRLHHVRGHLVRRGGQLFWRLPHLRGSAALGTVRTRTVTWIVGDSRQEGS